MISNGWPYCLKSFCRIAAVGLQLAVFIGCESGAKPGPLGDTRKTPVASATMTPVGGGGGSGLGSSAGAGASDGSSAGGSPATGAPPGGSPAMGGVPGGMPGGMPAVGGMPAMGGMPGMGGMPAVGGMPGVGMPGVGGLPGTGLAGGSIPPGGISGGVPGGGTPGAGTPGGGTPGGIPIPNITPSPTVSAAFGKDEVARVTASVANNGQVEYKITTAPDGRAATEVSYTVAPYKSTTATVDKNTFVLDYQPDVTVAFKVGDKKCTAVLKKVGSTPNIMVSNVQPQGGITCAP